MAEVARGLPNQQLDISQILQEAKHRWLRPAEICVILNNHKNFQLRQEPPTQPPAGSLFLFDRKALRYYRKDGHRWRKKKDGKTVKEAHEKLKAGSVDVLQCYYAHGEENENFQRRCYWMVEGDFQNIVLVHYREVNEGYRSGISRLLSSPRSQLESPQNSSAPCSTQENSPAPTVQTSFTTHPNRVDWNGQTPSSEFEDVDSGDNPGASSSTQLAFGCISSLLSQGVAGCTELSRKPLGSWYPGSNLYNSAGSSSVWAGTHSSPRSEDIMHELKCYVDRGAASITHKLTDSELDVDRKVNDLVTCGDRLNTDLQVPPFTSKEDMTVINDCDFSFGNPSYQNYSDPQMIAPLTGQVQKSDKDVSQPNDKSAELKKLDSFSRWMDATIGVDCDESIMATDSGNYWNTLDAENDDKEVSSLSHHIQLGIDSLGPSLSQEQLFSICDFSPDWAYSGVETKVLIVGRFLGGKKPSAETKWGCMFGEVEVPAEVVLDNVIRCQAPLLNPGRVPFYVTCSNRLACSEVREFEYREKPRRTAAKCLPEDELRIQIRLGKLLSLGSERKLLNCSVSDCDKCKLISTMCAIKIDSGQLSPSNMLIQNLLADRLSQWLVSKIHEQGKGPHLLDDEGQGVIHLAASLGYHWAMGSIIAAGVSPNFRDARGRTGLHWASCFGREETVVALVRLGASPGAVDDPTPAFPGGQTAADLASSSGHKGIAAYLAEADLSGQLSQLNINENVTESRIATVTVAEAEVVPSDLGSGDQSLKGSLDAVRKSAVAVSLIQESFRNRSFRHRESNNTSDDSPDNSLDLAACALNKMQQKFGSFDNYLHSAAKSIQKKYRGWKGRNDYLDLRNHVVKIQAHVRGHQVRRQYKKLIWSVGILEKVILRWRRKGAGLRGFQGEKVVEDALPDVKKVDEYEFLRDGRKQKRDAVDKAFSRVKSMVRHREAREQYMRLVSNYKKLEIGGKGNTGSQVLDRSEKSTIEEAMPALNNQ